MPGLVVPALKRRSGSTSLRWHAHLQNRISVPARCSATPYKSPSSRASSAHAYSAAAMTLALYSPSACSATPPAAYSPPPYFRLSTSSPPRAQRIASGDTDDDRIADDPPS
ncbi:hypothetical protein K488DRAFT_90396 [Vararia minispora EC-137]|uniref:Uncharacterized protein n=1 Tax=Vararia minispora EC-137 TaxID=1314806 RepID=A0ACB8Q7Z1_9AGAM|nr:hypothetical protein K488DRAFT_90396 [Vararia minispora EC-137]